MGCASNPDPYGSGLTLAPKYGITTAHIHYKEGCMKRVLSALAVFGSVIVGSVTGEACFGPPSDDGGTPLDEQTACVGGLITQANTSTYYDVYIDIKGADAAQPSYTVLAEGADGWDVLPGDLKSALFIADIRAKNANKPVRTVFGPGLAGDLQRVDASIKLDTSATYYTLIATGCVERKPALHHEASETDCIPEGATECRVSLQYECATDAAADASTQDPLDVSFAHYPPPGADASAATSDAADGGDPLAARACT